MWVTISKIKSAYVRARSIQRISLSVDERATDYQLFAIIVWIDEILSYVATRVLVDTLVVSIARLKIMQT